jgi:hypothetical protein
VIVTAWSIPVDVQEGPFDTWMLWATIGAAVATLASAVVVGIQAVHTARSARAAVDAAEVARAGLGVAQRSAAAAVDAARTSERMFDQGERNRREAGTPKILVHTEDAHTQLFEQAQVGGSMKWVGASRLAQYRLDGSDVPPSMFREVAVRFPLIVVNDGPGSIVMYTTLMVHDVNQAPVSRVIGGRQTWVLRPQEMLTGHIYWHKQATQWVTQAEAGEGNDKTLYGQIEFTGGATQTVTETWEFEASGHALSRTFEDKEVAEFYPKIQSQLTRKSRTYQEPVEES